MRPEFGQHRERGWVDEPEITLSVQPHPDGGPASLQTPRRRLLVVVGVIVLVLSVAVFNRVGRKSRALVAPVPIVAVPVPVRPEMGTAKTLAIPIPVGPIPVGPTVQPPSAAIAGPPVSVLDVATSGGLSYQLASIGKQNFVVLSNSTQTKQSMALLGAGANLLAVSGSSLWVVQSADGVKSRITLYDALTLKPAGLSYEMAAPVKQVIADDAGLWLATAAGVYRIKDRLAPIKIHDLDGEISAIALDLPRSRLIVAIAKLVGTEVVALDPGSATVIDTNHLPLVDVSLAAASDAVWYAGYGDPGGDGGIGKFPSYSLSPGPDLSGDIGIGPGARIWGGEYVIWVNSSGNGLTSCIRDTDGHVFATWADLTGPFSSGGGVRLSIGFGAARSLSATAGCGG